MQILTILLLIWISGVSTYGFLELFLKILQLNYQTNTLALALALFGIGIGFLFYFLSKLNSKTKNTIITGFLMFITILIVSYYFIDGIQGLAFIMTTLIKIMLFYLICTVPMVGVMSLLNKQKNVFIFTGVSAIFFYFFIIFLIQFRPEISIPFYSTNELELLLLYFIVLIAFLEIGIMSMNYSDVIKKMTKYQTYDEYLLKKSNSVLNKYMIMIGGVLSLCYLLTYLLLISPDNILFNTGELIGIDLRSLYGILILVTFTIVCIFLFWYIIPKEKIKKPES